MAAPAHACVEYLQAVTRLRRMMKQHQRCTEAFVLRHGRVFAPAPLPAGFPMGRPQECFRNAALVALDDSRFTYVEGYASGLIPVPHAWCVNARGDVHDNTWADGGHSYFGIPFQTGFLRVFLLESGLYGLLDQPLMGWPLQHGRYRRRQFLCTLNP